MRRAFAITFALVLIAFGTSQALAANVLINVYPTDLAGNPIASIGVGEQYKLQFDVKDTRDPVPGFAGVFAAYADVTYQAALTSVAGPIVNDPFFPLVPTGDTSNPGLVLGAGGASISQQAPGNAVQHLLSILFTANAQGTVSFDPTFDAQPNHDVLLYGVDSIIDVDDIQFSGSRLAIVPEPASVIMGLMGAAVLGAVLIRKRRARG